MFILPFIHETTAQAPLTVHTIKLLTVGGRDIWEEADNLTVNKDILNPNDIYAKSKPVKFDRALRLCAVDTARTQVADFYKWNELPATDAETFCWRTFVYVASDNDNWLTIPATEKLGKYIVRDIVRAIIEKK
jgi:hypothetical protein